MANVHTIARQCTRKFPTLVSEAFSSEFDDYNHDFIAGRFTGSKKISHKIFNVDSNIHLILVLNFMTYKKVN